jgi:hypothetical protein
MNSVFYLFLSWIALSLPIAMLVGRVIASGETKSPVYAGEMKPRYDEPIERVA